MPSWFQLFIQIFEKKIQLVFFFSCSIKMKYLLIVIWLHRNLYILCVHKIQISYFPRTDKSQILLWIAKNETHWHISSWKHVVTTIVYHLCVICIVYPYNTNEENRTKNGTWIWLWLFWWHEHENHTGKHVMYALTLHYIWYAVLYLRRYVNSVSKAFHQIYTHTYIHWSS